MRDARKRAASRSLVRSREWLGRRLEKGGKGFVKGGRGIALASRLGLSELNLLASLLV